ncbi:MAG TPA: methyltransferase domain-containing protein [Acidimicrobiales bacterium]
MAARLRIAFFGTYDERRHPRVRVLREGLAARGHDLTVVNIPLGVDTAGRVALATHPWRSPLFVARLAVAWLRLLWRSRHLHRPDVVVVGYLGHLDVHLARLRWPRARLVLDHMVSLADTARDRGLTRVPGVVRALDLVDRAATAQADIVVVDTAEQCATVPPGHRRKVVVVPVGAPLAWFAARERRAAGNGDGAARRPLRVVFFGLFTPLQGAPTIGRAIRRLADRDIRWTMIGTGQDRAAAEAEAGDAAVRWLDWVDADDLPDVVAAHDVCLGIFGTGAKAVRVVPNKAYQGAAAGCAVVTSDTPAQRAALGGAAHYIRPGDADALAATIAALADDPGLVAGSQAAAAARASRAFTPAAVVAGLADALTCAHDGPVTRGAFTRPAPASRRRATAHPPLPPNAALRWHVVRRHVRALAPATVLECGTGQGAVGARLCQGATYVGVEPDGLSRATAARRLPSGTRLLAGIDELGDDERFDLLCAFEVLEHLDDDAGTLAGWAARLRPGGHVLVSVPADPARFGPADELAGHLRRYSPRDLADLFTAAGLVTESVRHYGYPLGTVLEAGRNAVARRRLAAEVQPTDATSRTAGSGRHLQPPDGVGAAVWWATAPFRHLQDRFPDRGRGLVGLAQRPA